MEHALVILDSGTMEHKCNVNPVHIDVAHVIQTESVLHALQQGKLT